MENKEQNSKPGSDQNRKSFFANRDEAKPTETPAKKADMASPIKTDSPKSNNGDGTEEKKNLEEYVQPNPKKPIDPTVESQA